MSRFKFKYVNHRTFRSHGGLTSIFFHFVATTITQEISIAGEVLAIVVYRIHRPSYSTQKAPKMHLVGMLELSSP